MKINFKPEKMRHEVAVQRFASPLRDAAPRDLEAFWRDRHTFNRALNADWVDLGPANYAGRATCLVADPRNSQILYAGSAAGGLWKSADGGDSWKICWPPSLSQNIGAVAIDPDIPERVICATGEGNLSTASYPGGGIFESEDCGFSWRSFVWIPSKRRMDANDRDQMPRRVASISFSAPVSGSGSRLIAVGSISNDPDLPGGLYGNVAADSPGELRWVDFWTARPYNCYSAVFHPTDPLTLYAAIEAGGELNGIWRTRDGFKTWERLSNGLPAGSLCGRISLAVTPAQPELVWALVSSRGRKVLGVFRSEDRGKTWENRAGQHFREEGQLAFNNTIAIHPEDPRIVMVGAKGLHRTVDGGQSWSFASSGTRATKPAERNPRYVHPDHHAILFTGGQMVYSANDGGVARSQDLGQTWDQHGSPGMNTVMFYAIDVAQKNAGIYGGGAQDNGTLLAGVEPGSGWKRTRRRRGEPRDFIEVVAGDGGYLVCDPEHEERIFASSFSTETHCHDPGRRWARGLLKAPWRKADPPVPEAEKDVLGLTVMAMQPRPVTGRRRELFLGTNRLWRTRDHGRTWKAANFQFDGSAVTAIEIANAEPATMYVGTANGAIFRSTDGGHEWSADLAGPEIPNRVITQLETHPRDAKHVVATVAASGRRSAMLNGDPRPFSHVFRSRDGGASWTDIDNGQLPNVVYSGLAFETRRPYRLFVAGDAGPWTLLEDGRWLSIAGNMPSAVISDIIYHAGTRSLTAGTYGRGMWRLKLPDTFTEEAGFDMVNADDELPLVEGLSMQRTVAAPRLVEPADGAVFGHFPRHTKLVCTPVIGASGYIFETTTETGLHEMKTSGMPVVSMEMVGAQAYTWRCWALYPNGICSMHSERRGFRYTV